MVTRQPKRKFKIGSLIRKVVLPLAAIGALAGAIMWPPSHKVIFEGPLKPWIDKIQPLAEQLAKPLHFAAQQQTITEKNREIQTLNSQIEQGRKDLATRDDRIKSLQAQVNEAQNHPSASPAPAAAAGPAGPAGGPQAVAAAGPAAAAADPDVKRTATVWTQMDPEAVAGLAQKLPIDYVVRVLGQMTPDQVGQVMEALPPDVAAKVTQAQSSR